MLGLARAITDTVWKIENTTMFEVVRTYVSENACEKRGETRARVVLWGSRRLGLELEFGIRVAVGVGLVCDL